MSHPEDNLPFILRVAVVWVNPLIKLASVRQLNSDDVPACPYNQSIEHDAEAFWRHYDKRTHVFYALAKTHYPIVMQSGIFLIGFMAAQLAQPYFVGALLDFIITGSSNTSVGIGYAIALAVLSLLSSIFLSSALYLTRRLGASVRSGVMMAAYEQTLRLSSNARQNVSGMQAVNLIGIDAEKIFLGAQFFNYLWLGPIVVVAAMLLLVPDIGPIPAVSAMVFLLCYIPAQAYLANIIKTARTRMIGLTDRRVKLIDEVLAFIRVVKYYAWEQPMERCIHEVRSEETTALQQYLFYMNVLYEIMYMAIPLATLLIISLLVFALRQPLNAVVVFRILAYLNITRLPVLYTGQALKFISDGWVGLDRLDAFLQLDTVCATPQLLAQDDTTPSITLKDATFAWPAFTLKNITFNTLKCNELVAVIGEVASGKSSFIQALLREMPLSTGDSTIEGSIAYCGQTPWIQNLSLRDNVLFGQSLDTEEKQIAYTKCLDAAALGLDLAAMPDGDQTEIGEKGINLSGGQKARVSIARALMAAQRKTIFLFDDPFSAVDSATGNAVFTRGIQGILRDKLRIVALNSHMHLLQHFDRILVLEDGALRFCGTPQQFVDSHIELMRKVTGLDGWATHAAARHEEVVQPPLAPAASSTLLDDMKSGPVAAVGLTVSSGVYSRLIQEEKRAVGLINYKYYFDYFSSFLLRRLDWAADVYSPLVAPSLTALLTIGGGSILGIASFYCSAQAMRVSSDLALVSWSFAQTSEAVLYYYVYFGITVGIVIVRCFVITNFSVQNAFNMSLALFRNIVTAPVDQFFDVKTQGEVINRFSKDTEAIDAMLPDTIAQVLINWTQLLSVLVLCLLTSPYFCLLVVVLGYGFYRVYMYFSSVSRDLKRLESVSKSPVYASLSETLSGISTIRAYGDSERFLLTHRERMETNQKYYYTYWMCQSWMTFRLELATSTIILFVSVVAVCLQGSLSEAALGLALSYCMQLTALFQRCIQLAVELTGCMTSVERVIEYLDVEQELNTSHPLALESPKVPIVGEGVVEFTDVWMKYRDNAPVLRGVSFRTKPGERIGIVGRTGSGKSSLVAALFRMVELEGGSITIDGRDISQIPLHALRSSMSIIPQDPVIFTGTIRFQLDPFHLYTDMEVWRVLRRVNLGSFVEQLPLQLLEPISTSGENLSQGQKQLICIARALIKRTSILVMDEATSAVDPHTDSIIQESLQLEVQERKLTILTIAHRIQTILNYDRILVLANNKVAEFGPPHDLLSNPNSFLFKSTSKQV